MTDEIPDDYHGYIWNIREGVGLVLPLNRRLIEFSELRASSSDLTELEAEVAAAYLRVALRAVELLLDERRA